MGTSGFPSQHSLIDEVNELRELAHNRRAASFNAFRRRLEKAKTAIKPNSETVPAAIEALFPVPAE